MSITSTSPCEGDRPPSRRGFTLVELVAVIALTGIVVGIVAVFIRLPMQAYQDIQKRAEIVDAADTLLDPHGVPW